MPLPRRCGILPHSRCLPPNSRPGCQPHGSDSRPTAVQSRPHARPFARSRIPTTDRLDQMTNVAMHDRFDALQSQGRLCRRQVLQLGGAGLGLNLAGLWQARAAAEATGAVAISPIKSCIIVFYYGGPSHIDTYDLKPEAPADVRGEFQPIATTVPGGFVGEHLPRMSRLMHKVALVRSMHHTNRLHDSASTEALTGRQSPQGDREEFAPISQFYPCYGSILTYLARERQVEIPHAALPFIFHNVVDTPC